MLIGYARVSTSEQSADMQVQALQAAGCERVFIETASGARADRPELEKALAFLRHSDQLVVWRLDRLARSLKQLIETVEMLDGRGIGFRSLTEAIDTTSAGGRLVFQIFGALAEFERALIRERTNAGLEAARRKGRKGGRPSALDATGLFQARALLADGKLTAKEVAKRLGVSVSTLYKHLAENNVAPKTSSVAASSP